MHSQWAQSTVSPTLQRRFPSKPSHSPPSSPLDTNIFPRAERNTPKALACQIVIGFATGFCYLISIFYAVNDLPLIMSTDSMCPLGDIYLQATGSRTGAVGLLAVTIAPVFCATIGCYVTAGRTIYALRVQDRGRQSEIPQSAMGDTGV